MRVIKKIGFSVVMASCFLGWEFHHKSKTATQVKQSMIEVCSQDNNCQSAVNNYFDNCFDSSYDLGSRRRSAGLDGDKLANCINSQAGSTYFVYEQ